MTTAELNKVRELREKKRRLEAKLATIKDALKSIVPVRTGQPPAQKLIPKIEALTIKIMELETALESLSAQIEETSLEILSELVTNINLTEKECEVLVRRYVFGDRFRDIQFMMNLSDASIFRLHADGIKKIAGFESMIIA